MKTRTDRNQSGNTLLMSYACVMEYYYEGSRSHPARYRLVVTACGCARGRVKEQ